MFGLCLLPEGEVGLVAFLSHAVEFAAGVLDILQCTAGEYAVSVFFVVGLYVEVDGSVRLVCEAVVEDLAHQFLLFDDMSGGVGFYAGWQHVECLHGLVVAVGVILRYLHGLQLFQAGFLLYLVIALVGIVLQMSHVSDVTHIAHLVTQMLQVAEQDVKRDGRAGMSQMWIAIDGGSADIHADMRRVDGLEALLLTSERIVDEKF